MAKKLQTCYSHLTDEELHKVDTSTLKCGDQEMLDIEFKARNDVLAEALEEKQSQITELTLQSKVLSYAYNWVQKDIDYLASEVHKAAPGDQLTEINQGISPKGQCSARGPGREDIIALFPGQADVDLALRSNALKK